MSEGWGNKTLFGFAKDTFWSTGIRKYQRFVSKLFVSFLKNQIPTDNTHFVIKDRSLMNASVVQMMRKFPDGYS
jgi:hypothetical protein